MEFAHETFLGLILWTNQILPAHHVDTKQLRILLRKSLGEEVLDHHKKISDFRRRISKLIWSVSDLPEDGKEASSLGCAGTALHCR